MAPLNRHNESCVLLIDQGVHPDKSGPKLPIHLSQTSLGLFARALRAVEVSLTVVRYARSTELAGALFDAIGTPDETVLAAPEVSALSVEAVRSFLSMDVCPKLFIGGLWLEDTVSFAALEALALGHDTYLLSDLTFYRQHILQAPAMNRLVQAGVVPTTVRQVVAEWLVTCNEMATSEKLTALIHEFDRDGLP